MRCLRCDMLFPSGTHEACISGSILGDEYTELYYLCPACDVYSVAIWRDNFTTGEETLRVSGPISREEGQEKIALIRKCFRPWDKKCRCEAHCAYFQGCLD